MASLTVLDTDILIDHFRGLRDATLWISALPLGGRAVTDVTVMELFRGAANRQELDAGVHSNAPKPSGIMASIS